MDAIGIANTIKDGGLAALVGVLLWMLYSIVAGREKTRDEAISKLVEATQKIISALDAQATVLEKLCTAHEAHAQECRQRLGDMGTAVSLIRAKVEAG